MLKPLKLQRIADVDVLYQETYPNNYDGVLRGSAYWYPHPIDIKGYYGKFAILEHYIPPEIDMGGTWLYHYVDMDHPKCYYCGKFVKKGDWWKGRYTGNCVDCYEDLRFSY